MACRGALGGGRTSPPSLGPPTAKRAGTGAGGPLTSGGLACFASCRSRSVAGGPVPFSSFAVSGPAVCVASWSLLSSVPGRVSFFTSGSENLHRVEKVHWGTRYAVTIAFTCNPDHGIADPVFT